MVTLRANLHLSTPLFSFLQVSRSDAVAMGLSQRIVEVAELRKQQPQPQQPQLQPQQSQPDGDQGEVVGQGLEIDIGAGAGVGMNGSVKGLSNGNVKVTSASARINGMDELVVPSQQQQQQQQQPQQQQQQQQQQQPHVILQPLEVDVAVVG